MSDFVDASPAKRFFVEMLIRDIRLEDAILDLVDNAIDSLMRHKNIDLEDLVTPLNGDSANADNSHFVTIKIQNDMLSIEDNCGGIDIDYAKSHVFRFGAHDLPENAHLSVYGIGLKRAVFKIGREIVVESKTLNAGFRVMINVQDFESAADWRFPMEEIEKAENPDQCGTTITIQDLSETTKTRLESGSFKSNLFTSIGESYSLFLDRFVSVELNEEKVPPITIPISNSQEISASLTKETIANVAVTIVVGLQRLDGSDWRGNTAGWYIVCNGRVVVFADRTELTGWGAGSLPSFQPKHRGFIGIALFMSKDPEALPWTTTKRGVNAESPVFQSIKERMNIDARQVISFLDHRYSSVPVSSENTDDLEVQDRSLREALQPVSANKIFSDEPRQFSTSKTIEKRPKMVSVQYSTEARNIERARLAIGKTRMASGKVGLHALNYFLENEADE